VFYKKVVCFLCFFMFFGCVEENPDWISLETEEISEVQEDSRDFTWICHNPESKFHGEECVGEAEEGCLSPGDTAKFCWILTSDDCENERFQKEYKFCE
jgi:hypothetical protein